MKEDLPVRKSPAHFDGVLASHKAAIVFVTVCTQGRKPILANERVHQLLVKSWQEQEAWLVGRYVILPDHLHLFCSPAHLGEKPLRTWIKIWKSQVSRQWPAEGQQPVWQRGFWDRELRSGESYGQKWDYVRNNPVRHGLREEAEMWPFQGELNLLPW